jgi:hypothetical protein
MGVFVEESSVKLTISLKKIVTSENSSTIVALSRLNFSIITLGNMLRRSPCDNDFSISVFSLFSSTLFVSKNLFLTKVSKLYDIKAMITARAANKKVMLRQIQTSPVRYTKRRIKVATQKMILVPTANGKKRVEKLKIYKRSKELCATK